MPRVVVIEGPMSGESFEFDSDTIFVGRSLRNDFQVKDAAISRKHLKIFRIGTKFFVEDLRSTNGTLINGAAIRPGEGFEVGEEDTISIGRTVMRLAGVPGRKGPGEMSPAPPPEKAPADKNGRPSRERRADTGRDLELVYNISELLGKSMNIREFLKRVLDFIMETLPRIDTAAVFLCDPGGGEIRDVVSRSRSGADKGDPARARPVVEQVLRDRKPLRMSNTRYERPGKTAEAAETLQMGSLMCVPMVSNTEIRGVIYVDSVQRPYGFRKDDLLLLNTLSGPVALAVEKASLDGAAGGAAS